MSVASVLNPGGQGNPMSIASVLNQSGTSSAQPQAGSSYSQPQAGSSAQPQAESSSSQNPPSTNPPYDPATSFPRSNGDVATWLEYKRSQVFEAYPHTCKSGVTLSRVGIKDEGCVDRETRLILRNFILENNGTAAYRQLVSNDNPDVNY